MRAPLSLIAVAALVSASFAQTTKWSFIVAGDGRSSPKDNRPEDRDGINTKITGEIAKAALDEHAKMLLWTGDLVLGYTKTAVEFETMLTSWRGIMQPLYDAGVKVLPCRGNHDAGGYDGVKVWNKVFAGKYALPQNGPVNEKNLTFFCEMNGVLAIGLDQYGERKESIDQKWLDGVLASHKAPFVFAMGHEPAFMDGAHKDTMDADPGARDAFWTSLLKAGSRVFFAGHDHLYDHMIVQKISTSSIAPAVHQVVAGTAGAPFYKGGQYTGKNEGWTLTRVKHIENTYGYILVEIDGNKATITFKGRGDDGKYTAMDSFSYTVSGP